MNGLRCLFVRGREGLLTLADLQRCWIGMFVFKIDICEIVRNQVYVLYNIDREGKGPVLFGGAAGRCGVLYSKWSGLRQRILA